VTPKRSIAMAWLALNTKQLTAMLIVLHFQDGLSLVGRDNFCFSSKQI
jgi:hypothetical protein